MLLNLRYFQTIIAPKSGQVLAVTLQKLTHELQKQGKIFPTFMQT
jgi:hypothetical protein